jgi:hypothetical protein
MEVDKLIKTLILIIVLFSGVILPLPVKQRENGGQRYVPPITIVDRGPTLH